MEDASAEHNADPGSALAKSLEASRPDISPLLPLIKTSFPADALLDLPGSEPVLPVSTAAQGNPGNYLSLKRLGVQLG